MFHLTLRCPRLPVAILLVAALPDNTFADESGPRFEKLPNGMRVCIVEEHSQPFISIQLWFRGGSALDPPAMPGLCHIAMNALAIVATEAAQGRTSAPEFSVGTRADTGFLSVEISRGELAPTLAFLAGTMKPPDFTSSQLRKARDQATANWGLPEQTPQQATQRRLLNALFPKSPWAYPPDFVGQSAADLTPDALNEFIATWFAPAAATLFVIGDVDFPSALATARDSFTGIPWREPPPRKEQVRPAIEKLDADSTLDHLAVAWLGPAPFQFDLIAARVTHQLLEQALGTDPAGDADQVPASCAGTTFIWNLPSSWKKIPTLSFVFSRLAPDALSEQHLNQARRQIQRAELQSGFGFEHWARRLAEAEMIGGDVLLAGTGARFAEHITKSDVMRLADALENRTRRIILWPADRRPADLARAPELASPLRPEIPMSAATSGADAPVRCRTRTGATAGGMRWTNCPLPPCGFVQLTLTARTEKNSPPDPAWIWMGKFDSRDQFRAFLLARGLGSTHTSDRDEWSIRIDGPSTEIDAMLELLANAAKNAKPILPPDQIELAVCGDFSDAEASAFADRLLNQ